MTNDTSNDRFGAADREPDADEEAAAERSADQVDTDSVGEHEEEMNELGATAKGEGKITP